MIESLLPQVFRQMFLTETTIEVEVQLANAARADLLAALVIFERHLPDRPCSRPGNNSGHEIATEWNRFRRLLRQRAQTQATRHRGNEIARIIAPIGRIQWLTIPRGHPQDGASPRRQQNRKSDKWNRLQASCQADQRR